ncbi:MAG TPA: pilus assembly protein TadG-related protein [Bacillota bacterium]|nr:pilus assembly protein TadG-related protein [Bacillota bacterium]
MKQAFRDIIDGEKGSVIIIVAAAMVLLLGIAALVVDVGLLYYNKVVLSNAADAAALAGVQELPKDHGKAGEIAEAYAVTNGVEPGQVSAEVLPDGRSIQVATSRVVPLGFAKILGFSSAKVTASAKASVGATKGLWGAAPFGVVEDSFVYGETYTMKYSPRNSGEVGPGNFGALALGGTGANNYLNNIKYGYQGRLEVGDEIPTILETEPGNMAGPTKSGVDFRIGGCNHEPKCTYDRFVKGCKRLLLVPVIDSLDVTGRSGVKLIGFAAFFVEAVEGAGNACTVTGRFVRWAADGDLGNINDYGVVSYRLDN